MEPRARTRIRLTAAGIAGAGALLLAGLGLLSGWRAVEVYSQTRALDRWQLGTARGLVYWGEPVAHSNATQAGSHFYIHTMPVEEVIDPPAPRFYGWQWKLDRPRDGYCTWLIPVWAPILVLGTVSAGLIRDTVRDRRITSNRCPYCGYDRRGLAADVVCPECGAHPKPRACSVLSVLNPLHIPCGQRHPNTPPIRHAYTTASITAPGSVLHGRPFQMQSVMALPP